LEIQEAVRALLRPRPHAFEVIPMQAKSLTLFLLGFGPALVAPVRAEVTVRFDHPDQYTDLQLSNGSMPKVKADLMNQLEKYLKTLGDQYLPKGDSLAIAVENIDMAGGFEPWRMPNLSWTRVISDVYPPRFDLRYVWKDPAGRVKADRREQVTDLNYRTMVNERQFSQRDPLRYEKALLQRWFRKTFGAGE
jgi:hypothetical protein